MTLFSNLASMLLWLTGSDAGAFVTIIVFTSLFLEKWATWQKLTSTSKYFIIIFASIGLGLGAQALGTHPDIVMKMEPWFRPVMYIFMASTGYDLVHKLDKKITTK